MTYDQRHAELKIAAALLMHDFPGVHIEVQKYHLHPRRRHFYVNVHPWPGQPDGSGLHADLAECLSYLRGVVDALRLAKSLRSAQVQPAQFPDLAAVRDFARQHNLPDTLMPVFVVDIAAYILQDNPRYTTISSLSYLNS